MKRIALADSPTKDVVFEIDRVLCGGGMCVVPTDTVYGLVVDATNASAVDKLLSFKNRPAGKPISVFVSDIDTARKMLKLSKEHEKTLTELVPGPFTFVLPYRGGVDGRLVSEFGGLGIRIPKNELIGMLTQRYAVPLTATSANTSGKGPHYDIKAFFSTLSERKKNMIDLVVDGGALPRNKPSTVIDLTGERISLIRKGDRKPEDTTIQISSALSESSEQTQKIAGAFFKRFQSEMNGSSSVSLLLEGPLGVGKTVFVRGIARELEVDKIISPTYVIYYEYDISQNHIFERLYHVDLFRLEDDEEFEHLGFDEMFAHNSIVCIEWSQKSQHILSLLKEKSVVFFVTMAYVSEKKRRITISRTENV